MSLDTLANKIESVIAKKLVSLALSAGFEITVFDSEEFVFKNPTKEKSKILEAMASTDDDYLYLHKDGKRVGWIWLIYGNAEDLISDYSYNDTTHDFMEKKVYPAIESM